MMTSGSVRRVWLAVDVEARLVAVDAVWKEDEPVEIRPGAVGAEAEAVLAADGEAGEGRARLYEFDMERLGRRRFEAVHLVGEDVENLAASRLPVVLCLHGSSVCEDERVGQRVRRHLGFIVVDFARGRGLLLVHGFLHA